MNTRVTLLGLTFLLISGAALAAVPQGRHGLQERQGAPVGRVRPGGAREPQGGERVEGSRRHGLLGRMLHRRQAARGFVRSLEITPEQREAAREVARSLAPLMDEVRPEARAILREARELARSGNREAARALIRSQLRPLIQDAVERAKPAVRPLVASLTAEQRARLEAAAAARGRVFDEERFTGWLTRRLARHGARR
ncbi:MAG: Spy/CpxP family protein refolding chaperone [Planctomycetes bacterium]|nr:Spy/CpxP family protein refolding chaperone [Planctomycetota bacterium]